MIRTLFFAAALSSAAAPAFAEAILAVRGDNQFIRFDSAAPGSVDVLGTPTGLAAGETIIGLDRRPANGEVFAVTSAARLYRISFGGGAPSATQIGVDGGFTLDSSTIGFNFNPIPDRIRVVSPTNRNLRLNPNTGALVMVDTPLSFAATDVNAGADPNVVATAYTNSFAPSPRTPPPGTTQYVIDSNLDILAIQAPPNDGILTTVGSLGVDVIDATALDISGVTGIAYLLSADAVTTPGINDFFTVDLGTGAATLIGNVPGNRILAFTVADVPAPATLALFGLGLAGFALSRRR